MPTDLTHAKGGLLCDRADCIDMPEQLGALDGDDGLGFCRTLGAGALRDDLLPVARDGFLVVCLVLLMVTISK
jgi:hypothetical protein